MNQDYIYTSETSVGNLPNLFIVADGMGGHNAGDFASRYTVEHVVEAVKSSGLTEPVSLLGEALRQTNSSLMELAEKDPHLRGTGTTFVAATIAQGRMSVANIGDSRLYIAGQRFEQITRDHSYVQELVRRGKLEPKEARLHPDRNIITRAVGGGPKIEIDFFEVELKEKDRILMCSDGLTDMLEDGEIAKIIEDGAETGDMIDELIRMANEHGGNDNITVILTDPFAADADWRLKC